MSVIGSYLLYYFIVISSTVIAWFSSLFKNDKNKRIAKFIFFSAILFPVVISGFRNGVGTDYDNYVVIYHQLYSFYNGLFDAISNSRLEPGWIALNYLVRITVDDVRYVFVIAALLTWLFSFKAIYDNRKHISVGIAVLILLCTLYNMSFNIVRQVLAISIVMLSIKPMLDQRKWKFLFTILIASSFHFIALVFTPAYWIIHSKTGNRSLLKRLFVVALCVGLVFFFQPIFNFFSNNFQIFATYRSYSVEYSGFSVIAIALKIPILILILFNAKKLKNKENPMQKLNVLFLIGVILMILSSYSPYLNRISFFFDMTQIFIVSAIVKCQTNKYEQLLYIYLIVIYYLARFTYFYLVSGNAGTIPYKF